MKSIKQKYVKFLKYISFLNYCVIWFWHQFKVQASYKIANISQVEC